MPGIRASVQEMPKVPLGRCGTGRRVLDAVVGFRETNIQVGPDFGGQVTGIKGHSMASLDALGALATRHKLREQAGLRLRALVFDVEGRRG